MSEDEKTDLSNVAADEASLPKAEASTSSKPTFTVADVFGGDDSDSDLSSDEDDDDKPGQ